MTALGFPNCINKCEDFYKTVETNSQPEHDVIMTNPPYSELHIQRCFEYCISSGKPWCLLLPNWVARKDFFVTLFKDNLRPLVLSPVQRYDYIMPGWATERPSYVGSDGKHSPFLSSWFISLGENSKCSQDDFFQIIDVETKAKNVDHSFVVARTAKGTKWKIRAWLEKKNSETNPELLKKKSKKKRKKNRKRLPRHLRAAALRHEKKRIEQGKKSSGKKRNATALNEKSKNTNQKKGKYRKRKVRKMSKMKSLYKL
eukprot:g6304.t1